jgi:hypothetical protein
MSDSYIVKEWFRYAHNDLIVACHSFEDLHPKQTEIAIQDICADLTPFAVTVRYPNELAPDEAIAKHAIAKAQQIYDFCVSKIPGTEDEIKVVEG